MSSRLATLFKPYVIPPEEDLILVCREDWRALVPLGFLSGLGMVGSGMALLYVGKMAELSGIVTRGIGMALAIVLLLLWFFAVVRWYYRVLVVTDRRIVMRRGIVGRDVWEAPIGRVQSVTTAIDFQSRVLGVGELRIGTGALPGQIAFPGLRRVEAVSNQISEVLTAYALEQEAIEMEEIRSRLRQRLNL